MKLLLFFILLHVTLRAAVSYDNEKSEERIIQQLKQNEKEIHIINEQLKKVSKALGKTNKLLDKICHTIQPIVFDINGNIIEEDG